MTIPDSYERETPVLSNDDLTLSLILPCYCEASHLHESLDRITSFLEHSGMSHEIILVEDCSPDNTAELVQEAKEKHKHVRALYHEENQGRGGAVTTGLLAAEGTYAGFIDVDLEVDICYVSAMILELENGADVVTGWRHYNMSLLPSAIIRCICSRGYPILCHRMLGVDLQDTETGYKFFRRRAILPVNEKVVSKGWFWDTEIMVRAHQAGLKIVEKPVLFKRRLDKRSTVRLIPDTIDYFRELRRFRGRLKKEKKELSRTEART